MTSWCYWKEDIGPANWGKHYPAANGQRQSPIDIKKSEVVFDPNLKSGNFEFHYFPEDCLELLNKGVTWCIKIRQDGQSYLNASHLPFEYKLLDVHCHWGADPCCGSEHLVDGKSYAAEIHIVHMNRKYDKFEEALKKGDGLAVLGIFLEESDVENKALTPLIHCIKSAKYKDEKILLQKGFALKDIIPNDLQFWTYDGSLTTPPCCECVIWTVFRKPIPASKSQIQAFRDLRCASKADIGCCVRMTSNERRIINNYRKPQPLHGRKIRASFEY